MTDPVSSAMAATPVSLNPAQPYVAAPTAAAVPRQVHAAATPADLHAIAEALGKAFQPTQTDLHFQVDKITGQMVISVIDAQDGKTLLQIPGEEALAVAQSLEQQQARLIQ